MTLDMNIDDVAVAAAAASAAVVYDPRIIQPIHHPRSPRKLVPRFPTTSSPMRNHSVVDLNCLK